MESSVQVDLVSGRSHVTGVGMTANNATSVVEVLDSARIVIPPRKAVPAK